MTLLYLAPWAAQSARAQDSGYPIQTVPSKQVKISGGFWGQRLETNRTVSIPHLIRMNAETDRLDNLKRGAGMMDGSYVSRRYNDTDVYKIIEAASFSLMMHPDPALEKELDDQIAIIAAAQRPDGYLFPALTIDPANPAPGVGPGRWDSLNGSHELYNHGHMIEAAVAHYQATGKRNFLDVAIKAADMLCATFGPEEGKRKATSGHEEIELALPKLYLATGEKKYLDLLKFFIDQRGKRHGVTEYTETNPDGSRNAFYMYNDRQYRQDHLPLVEQDEAWGHAVRATYLYGGLTDLAALTGIADYTRATDRLWDNVVSKKMYVTGGVGSIGGTEAFGPAYSLPNQGYAESCAQIGFALWNERLFLLHGDAKYLDVMERVVYNGFLSGISLKGDSFFYQNHLQAGERRGGRGGRAGRRGNRRGGDAATTASLGGGGAFEGGTSQGAAAAAAEISDPRQNWWPASGVACCPANLARMVAQFPSYIYATGPDALYINFFVAGEATANVGGRNVRVAQQTDYPWKGDVRITLEPETEGEFTVHVRVPEWARGQALPTDLYTYQPVGNNSDMIRLVVNGAPQSLSIQNGFARLRRAWKRGDTIELHLPLIPRQVVANENVEADRGMAAIELGPFVYCVEGVDNGGDVANLTLAPDAALSVEFRPDLLGGINVVKAGGGASQLTAVPYCLWGNRGGGAMRVWIPRPGAQE
jgi:hypothetical protein